MFKKKSMGGAIVLVLTMAPFVYAGKVELTTYYPAPFGEYSELKATGKTAANTDTAFAAGGNAGTGLVVTNANQVGIGIAEPLGILDITSTTLPFYPPRVTTAQRNAIAAASLAEGAVVYNNTTNALEAYNGSAWVGATGAATAGLSCYRGVDTLSPRCPDNSGSFTGDEVCNAVGKTCAAVQLDADRSCAFNISCSNFGNSWNNSNDTIIWCK